MSLPNIHSPTDINIQFNFYSFPTVAILSTFYAYSLPFLFEKFCTLTHTH